MTPSCDAAGAGFSGVALAHNVEQRSGGRRGPARGGSRRRPHRQAGAQRAFWGGYSGYFADPDGHSWEVAHNPGFPLDAEGRVTLPPPNRMKIPS